MQPARNSLISRRMASNSPRLCDSGTLRTMVSCVTSTPLGADGKQWACPKSSRFSSNDKDVEIFTQIMANDPTFRDLSLHPFLEKFDEVTVLRIDKFSIISSVVAALFGVVYFAIAARTTAVQIVSNETAGYDCIMMSTKSLSYDPFLRNSYSAAPGIVPLLSQNTFISQLSVAAEKLPGKDNQGVGWDWFFSHNLVFSRLLFEKYSDCLASANTQTTCDFTDIVNSGGDNNYCLARMRCSSFNGKAALVLPSSNFITARNVYFLKTSLADDKIGACASPAVPSNCTLITQHCSGVQNFVAAFQNLVKQYILTPELLCEPFKYNPPYACTRTVPANGFSVLSQSLALATSALAASKTVMFLFVKYLKSR